MNRACLRASRAVAEVLERRMLLALSPAGPEFRLNSYTTETQWAPSIAIDGAGDFVATWHSFGQDGSGFGIYAQRYNASGVAQGPEFRVNSFTTGDQVHPAVAMSATGNFVVTWASPQDGSGYGVYAQRYNAAGVSQGAEFRVNTFTNLLQAGQSVAMDASGNFVVAWQSYAQDGNGYGVYAQRYSASGVPQGVEFRVNTFTNSAQWAPSVARDGDGDFAVVWHSYAQDGNSFGVYAQRYNAAGVPQGTEFRVNSFTTGNQNSPSVAMDTSGDFVVAWESPEAGGGYRIYAQRYNSAAVPQGGEFKVNTFTFNNQFKPAVAADSDGDFVVTWHSGSQDGSGYGIFAQRYNAAGAAEGTEFQVNTFITSHQSFPAVAMDASGDFVVAWQGLGQDGALYGVYAQRYDQTTGPSVLGVFVNGKQTLPYSVHAGPVAEIVVSFSEAVVDTGGPNSVTNLANWRVTHHNGTTTSNVPLSGIHYSFNSAATRFEATLQLSSSFASGNLQVIALDNIRDLGGNALDGNLDGTSGGHASRTFGIGEYRARGGEFRINSFTPSFQQDPSIAIDADGDFVAVWHSYAQDGSSYGIYAQRYNALGVPQGAEFRVNTFTTARQVAPFVAMHASGNFVVAWSSFGQDGSGLGAYAQRFNALGVPQGAEFRVNTFTTGDQFPQAVAMDADGDFVVAWSSYGQDGDIHGVYAQLYNAAGVPQGGEFRVNSVTASYQFDPSVAMHASGEFVVAWTSNGQDGGGTGIYARRFSPFGVALGPEFRVNTFTTNFQSAPSVAMDADGDFLVAWQSFGQDDLYGIYAQAFNAAGVAQGPEFRVNSFTPTNQTIPAVGMSAAGDFVVAWQSVLQDGSGFGIYAQAFDAAGVPRGAEFRVNSYTTNHQWDCAVAMDANGDFLVAWEGNVQDGSGYGIFAQRYNLGATPSVGALSDSPDPAIPGAPITLTASGVTDDMFALGMRFYREANGIAGLQFGPGGDTLVFTDDNGGDGWVAVISTANLSPGTYLYYAQAADDEGLVGAPATTTHTLFDAAPIVRSAQFLYETFPQKLRFTFDQNVSASLSASDFSSIGTPGVDYEISYDADTNTATLTFTHVIADGNYTATVVAAEVTSAFGTPMDANFPFAFHFLRGDADGDGDVDVNDLGILASNWQQSPRTFSQGNFDYSPDGLVGVGDLGLLATNWQQDLFPGAPLAPAAKKALGRSPRLVEAVGL